MDFDDLDIPVLPLVGGIKEHVGSRVGDKCCSLRKDCAVYKNPVPKHFDKFYHLFGGDNDVLVNTNGSATSKDQQAMVHVKYECLSIESKKKLEELLSKWSEWDAAHCASSKDPFHALESGGKTYFPSLQVGTENSPASIRMETQPMKKQETDCLSLNGEIFPPYDRDYAFNLKLTEGSKDRGFIPLNASHCSSCGTYGHSLKECRKPRDNIAVSNARKEHQFRKNQNGGPQVLTPYYQNTPRGKYDGLKPDPFDELLKFVIVERNPPPHASHDNSMRELGYPPGFLGEEYKTCGIKARDKSVEHSFTA